MKKNIHLEIRDEKSSAEDFVTAWKKAESGKTLSSAEERIYFKDMKTLLRFMTPRRMDAVEVLHKHGPTSVRALAKILGRDYKNVHQDMRELEKIRLVLKNDKGLLSVPWQSIIAELKFAA